jgi:hypothetical protein
MTTIASEPTVEVALDDDEYLRIVLQSVLWGDIRATAESLGMRDEPMTPLYWMDFTNAPKVIERAETAGRYARALKTVMDLDATSVCIPLTRDVLRDKAIDVAKGCLENIGGTELVGEEKHRAVDVALRAEAFAEELGGEAVTA